jgi:hypothetical protein
MSKSVQLILIAAVLAAVSSCGVQKSVKKFVGLGDDDLTVYSGPLYPATSKIAIAFQPAQVSKSCRVFAESLVLFPANVSGKDIEASVLAEAGKRGADQVLVGQTRQGADDDGLQFLYYGPKHEYLCTEQCGGWKFGFSLWEKQGHWVSVGFAEWGKATAHFETPLVMQIAMLRCQ